MSTVQEKMGKQFEYQQTLFATSKDPMDLFVSVDRMAEYLGQQMRADLRGVRRQVKDELERMAGAGQVRRWAQVHGPSSRPDRVDHYFLPGRCCDLYGTGDHDSTEHQQVVSDECLAGRCANCWDDNCACVMCGHPGTKETA